jgi:hypothetical protein
VYTENKLEQQMEFFKRQRMQRRRNPEETGTGTGTSASLPTPPLSSFGNQQQNDTADSEVKVAGLGSSAAGLGGLKTKSLEPIKVSADIPEPKTYAQFIFENLDDEQVKSFGSVTEVETALNNMDRGVVQTIHAYANTRAIDNMLNLFIQNAFARIDEDMEEEEKDTTLIIEEPEEITTTPNIVALEAPAVGFDMAKERMLFQYQYYEQRVPKRGTQQEELRNYYPFLELKSRTTPLPNVEEYVRAALIANQGEEETSNLLSTMSQSQILQMGIKMFKNTVIILLRQNGNAQVIYPGKSTTTYEPRGYNLKEFVWTSSIEFCSYNYAVLATKTNIPKLGTINENNILKTPKLPVAYSLTGAVANVNLNLKNSANVAFAYLNEVWLSKKSAKTQQRMTYEVLIFGDATDYRNKRAKDPSMTLQLYMGTPLKDQAEVADFSYSRDTFIEAFRDSELGGGRTIRQDGFQIATTDPLEGEWKNNPKGLPMKQRMITDKRRSKRRSKHSKRSSHSNVPQSLKARVDRIRSKR